MYSRYKIEEPSPPPDYAGTAFAAVRPSMTPAPAPNNAPDGGSFGENQGTSRPGPIPVPLSEPMPRPNPEVILPEPDIDPGFTLDPDEEFPPSAPTFPNVPDGPDGPDEPDEPDEPDGPDWPDESAGPEPFPETPEAGPEPSDQPGENVPVPAEPDEPGKSLLDRLNPDDLLFVGAMLYLMSGKDGSDSFLLLAYLLTCGL